MVFINFVQVYYLPIKTFYNQCVLPTMVCSLPLIRNVFIREQITHVHGHSAFSTLAHEAMIIGRLLGLKVRYVMQQWVGGCWISSEVNLNQAWDKINIKLMNHISNMFRSRDTFFRYWRAMQIILQVVYQKHHHIDQPSREKAFNI